MAVKLKPLAEQRIVITGASSGIGLATARMAAAGGASVLLVARNEEALAEAAAQIEATDGRAAYIAIDVTEEGAPERIGAAAFKAYGGFDTWVNDASVTVYARLDETSMAEHRRIFDVNYFAYVSASLFAAEELRSKGGALINVGSILSDRAVPVQGAYSAAKHAVKGFTDALRMELEMDRAPVSVTLIKPGSTDTPFPEHSRNKMDAPATVPPIVYDPALVAEAILFAAQHPKRELVVGGGGALIAAGNVLGRVTDKLMEAFGGEVAQSTATPPEPGAEDNLFEPSEDGRTHGNQEHHSRQTSLALKAQMHPVATAAIIGGGAAAAAGAFFGHRALARKRMNSVMETAITACDLAASQALAEPHPPTEPRIEVAADRG
ncbi:MAG TPA: SDR family oxidoreductase [Allosphingosinicella sp.]|jgi:short-subunit dehydrogenase|uniref:SDR family oxidoreductase n=1 Tax=Allosphingosinicella sp. TaxID=2823234 RepID=UPI002F2ACE51